MSAFSVSYWNILLIFLNITKIKFISLHDLNCYFETKTRFVIFPYKLLCLCFIISLSDSYIFYINLSSTLLLLSISFPFSYIHNHSRFHYSPRPLRKVLVILYAPPSRLSADWNTDSCTSLSATAANLCLGLAWSFTPFLQAWKMCVLTVRIK